MQDKIIEVLNEVQEEVNDNICLPDNDLHRYNEALTYAKEAVGRMEQYPLLNVNKSVTQGHCICGRLLYREFKVCPICERRPLWPDVPKDDESQEDNDGDTTQ